MLSSAYRLRLLMLLVNALLLQAAAANDIFRCKDRAGNISFQQQPCGGDEAAQSGAAPQLSATPAGHASTAAHNSPASAANRCQQLADSILQIGRGYQANQSESELRARLAGQFAESELDLAFSAFQFGRSVPAGDLALFSQLVCETQLPLPPPQSWQLQKNEVEIKLQGWQQHWQWPSSWRLTGIREQPDVQIALAYADFDRMTLRVGCRAHNSGTRLTGMGPQLLALWAERLQPGSSTEWHARNNHPAGFGNSGGKDSESGRELFTAALPSKQGDGLGMGPKHATHVGLALTPQHLCLSVRAGETVDFKVAREAGALVEVLLTRKPLSRN